MSIELPDRVRLRPATVPDGGILEGPRLLRRLPEGVEERPYELFSLRPLGRVIGAEIGGVDLARPLTPALHAELNRALLEWKVLFFRDQDITSAHQRAFAANWGELETNPFIPKGRPRTPPGSPARRACPPSRTSGTWTSRSGPSPRSVRCCG